MEGDKPPPASQPVRPSGAAVFPGLQNYDRNFFTYNSNTEPVNLSLATPSNQSAAQPIDLSSPKWPSQQSSPLLTDSKVPQYAGNQTKAINHPILMKTDTSPKQKHHGQSKSAGHHKRKHSQPTQQVNPVLLTPFTQQSLPVPPGAAIISSSAITNALPIISVNNPTQKMILLMKSAPSSLAAPAVLASAGSPKATHAKFPNLLLAAPQTIAVVPQPHLSPAIQAALSKQNKPKATLAAASSSTITTFSNVHHPSVAVQPQVTTSSRVHQAPTMKHFLDKPPLQLESQPKTLQIKQPKKTSGKEKRKHHLASSAAATRPIMPLPPPPPDLMSLSNSNSTDRFVRTKVLPSQKPPSGPTSFQHMFSSAGAKFQPVDVSGISSSSPVKSGSSTSSLHNHNHTFTAVPSTQLITCASDDSNFNLLDLRTLEENKIKMEELVEPPHPRSVIESRMYKMKKKELQKRLNELNLANNPASTSFNLGDSSSAASGSTNQSQPFDWSTYFTHTNSKPAPGSAFKHVEASLQNGFVVGMKVETPLRTTDVGKYWLATIIKVYGPLLKLRFDGYGEDSQADFILPCNSENIHPIGWCSKNQRSLLPPAEIRASQKQWKFFLINSLQGAKTVPSYLLNSRGGPWVCDRIKPGMRLEVQHLDFPTAVWVAKVMRNVGGRLKLRYEGSIDATNDFWLFYREQRIHPYGWGVTNGCIFRPPTEIKYAFEYDAWSKILHNVGKDQTLEKLPADLVVGVPPVIPHKFKENSLVEVLHPSGLFIYPARISHVINNLYYKVEMLSIQRDKYPVFCYGESPYILPVGWCSKNKVSLQFGPGQPIPDPVKFWRDTIEQTKLECAIVTRSTPPTVQFKVGQRLEAVDPNNTENICLAYIQRILEHLIMLKVYTNDNQCLDVIVPADSQSIFPVGWAETNEYPVTTPSLSKIAPPSTFSSIKDGEHCPRIYFNHRCFSGPYLSKGRIGKLPLYVGAGSLPVVLRKMLGYVISVGYKTHRIVKLLQLQGQPRPNMAVVSIPTKDKWNSVDTSFEVCKDAASLADYLQMLTKKLECCPNLVSLTQVDKVCPHQCHNQTKTQYLYADGRPQGSSKDPSKKKKRKKRKHLFNPRRSLYAPRQASDNGSVSSTSDGTPEKLKLEPQSAARSLQAIAAAAAASNSNLKPEVKSEADVKEENGGLTVDVTHQSPLYQLHLASVQGMQKVEPGASTDGAQYQIINVKRKRGRPPKNSTPEFKRVVSTTTGELVVPPLKIRRLDYSPRSSVSETISLPADTQQAYTAGPLTLITTHSTIPSSRETQTRPQSDSAPTTATLQGLLKAATPHYMYKSALTFNRQRIHIEDRDKVILSDNPLDWGVQRLADFIRQTDCAYLAESLIEHAIDGQAFMMLVLPTVQTELELKLGPALKLCHHVQRLKLAYFETFHPEAET